MSNTAITAKLLAGARNEFRKKTIDFQVDQKIQELTDQTYKSVDSTRELKGQNRIRTLLIFYWSL